MGTSDLVVARADNMLLPSAIGKRSLSPRAPAVAALIVYSIRGSGSPDMSGDCAFTSYQPHD